MSEDVKQPVESIEPVVENSAPAELPVDPLANIDINSLDFSKPDELPEVIKQMKFVMPKGSVKMPLYKLLLSGLFNHPKPKISKSWYNGKLIPTSEFNELSLEEQRGWLNKITKSKNKLK